MSIQGQENICNYDPDIIFFENAQLEKLRQSIIKGDCSFNSIIWKAELGDALQTYFRNGMEMEDLSERDRETISELKHFQKDSPSVRFPDDTKYSSDILFESESRQSPHQFIQRDPNSFHSRSKQNSRNRQFYIMDRLKRQIKLSDLIVPNLPVERQSRFFVPNDKKLHNNFFTPNKKRTDELLKKSSDVDSKSFSDSDFPESNIRPTDQNSHQSLFIPNSKNIRNELVAAEDLFKPIEQTTPKLWEDDKRQKNHRPLGDIFIPAQHSAKNQRRPNKGRNSVNQRTPSTFQRPQMTTPPAVSDSTLPGPPAWPTAPSLCVQRCPNTPEYNPVCGSDRVTYVNPGRLRCEQQCGKAHVNVNYYGTCGTTTTSQPQSTTSTTTFRPTGRNLSRSRNLRTNPVITQ